MKTDDLRIVKTRPLLSPAVLAEEIPLTETASTKVSEARRAIEAILSASIESAVRMLRAAGLPEALMVDCSHGNSQKDAARQIDVADAIMQNPRASSVRALMLESHLMAGRQNAPVIYGQSITDACLGFQETEALLRRLADAV